MLPLVCCDLGDDLHPLREQLQDLVVHPVELAAKLRQRLPASVGVVIHGRVLHRRRADRILYGFIASLRRQVLDPFC